MSSVIKSGKWCIKEVFEKWYLIPNYQRPYVWGKDQVIDLLDDISISCENNNLGEYFLGSLVLKENKKEDYIEYEVLDGQQRLTTLFLLTAVIRDLTDNLKRKDNCQKSLFREADYDDNIPERLRIIFDIRDEVKDFVNKYIKLDQGTNSEALKALVNIKNNDASIYHMTNAILYMQEFIKEKIKENGDFLDKFVNFFRTKVIVIYVSSDDLSDAFRLFSILNNRGVKLRNSDILKANNLRVIKEKDKQQKYAKDWEGIENYFGEDFDNFLSHLHSILTKQKARLSLLKEFENNIFAKNKIKEGEEFFEFVKEYKNSYEELFDNNEDLELKNLLTLMKVGFEGEIWIAPLLHYHKKFGKNNLLIFTKNLNKKFASDWISGLTPTTRVYNINAIIDAIDNSSTIDELLEKDCFSINESELKTFFNGNIYGKRQARYILLLLNYLYHSPELPLVIPNIISIEHILPQNPKENSQWLKDFNDKELNEWKNKLGNLIILSRRKNSAQSNLDFSDKKSKYFKGNVELGRSAYIMATPAWSVGDLEKNHNEALAKLEEFFGLTSN